MVEAGGKITEIIDWKGAGGWDTVTYAADIAVDARQHAYVASAFDHAAYRIELAGAAVLPGLPPAALALLSSVICALGHRMLRPGHAVAPRHAPRALFIEAAPKTPADGSGRPC